MYLALLSSQNFLKLRCALLSCASAFNLAALFFAANPINPVDDLLADSGIERCSDVWRCAPGFVRFVCRGLHSEVCILRVVRWSL